MKKVDVTALATEISAVQVIHDKMRNQVMGSRSAIFDRDLRHSATADAIAALEARGAKVRDDYRGAAISHLGIRSTCTAGVLGAMANWRRAAIAARVAAIGAGDPA